ncbi:Dabb family protein [Deminuibacter soli]|uniref:Dabb family protein n=1 Tax=Deminuibacter soli TaxID=2291815 RepID=A0A3E1NK02_9BACT|nr:Dabb family protein [Deminuibacter soli]RFM28253.1 Dabb family protein [Deminuibacter soli]
MFKKSRRQFIAASAKTAAVTAVAGLGATGAKAAANNNPKVFVHHVYFWLKNPDNQEDKAKLLAGLKTLSTVKTIRQCHVGVPSSTNRDVIDRSYSVSWLLFFKDKADQDSYQVDPIHLNFVKECSQLWTKVIVYDSEDI